ncbi:MAG: carboxypeptidase-like regulatory domain-containing protein [Treponema sp.]|jgi:hypothetical protein|nr:carboxypeptidase-like regulatory domain-containing protein [Treponema sp.]
MKKTVFLAIAVFSLAGCLDPTSGTLYEKYKYPVEWWGEWIRVDTGKAWYIASNYLDGNSNPETLIMERQSANVIKVVDGSREYFLLASRMPNSSISGTVVDDNMTGIDDAEVIITNLKDKANEIRVRTESGGSFNAAGIIPGDEYEVIAHGQSIMVRPNSDGEGIGTVAVIEGENFKIRIILSGPNNEHTDIMRLYTDGTSYNFQIEITNTGTEEWESFSFKIKDPDKVVTSPADLSNEISLGKMTPGEKKTYSISVGCDRSKINGEYAHKRIGIAVTDRNNKPREDWVSLKFNREEAKFYFNSDGSPISGVIIIPNVKAYHFRTEGSPSYSKTITVPKYYGKDYLVVISGATPEIEARYSIGVDVSAYSPGDSEFIGFSDKNKNEPDNTEDDATALGNQDKIMSYLDKNDIDYFKVQF